MKKLIVFGVLFLAVVVVLGCTSTQTEPQKNDTNMNQTPNQPIIKEEPKIVNETPKTTEVTASKMSLRDAQNFVNAVFNKSYTFRAYEHEASIYGSLYSIYDKNYKRTMYFSGAGDDVILYELDDNNLLTSQEEFLKFIEMKYDIDKIYVAQWCTDTYSKDGFNCVTDSFKHMFYNDQIASLYQVTVEHSGVAGSNNDNAQSASSWASFWIYCSPKYVIEVYPSIMGSESDTGLSGWLGVSSNTVISNIFNSAIYNEDVIMPKAEKLVDACLAFK